MTRKPSREIAGLNGFGYDSSVCRNGHDHPPRLIQHDRRVRQQKCRRRRRNRDVQPCERAGCQKKICEKLNAPFRLGNELFAGSNQRVIPLLSASTMKIGKP